MKTYEFLNEDEQDTLRAIDDSIEHWKRLASGTANGGEEIFTEDCALCQKFIANECAGCPVSNYTGQSDCCGSPHRDCYCDYSQYGKTSKQFRSSAVVMLEFLTEVRNDFLAIAKEKK